ncbi:hypothetical protein K492DRAFT_208925 [Lichtheimia hyalospora FSU 10163]|nr:hypothetical protein K492DRAFT_208925 [Lichtheimia hyalospora FSU 10163]
MQHRPFDRIPFDVTAAIFEKLGRNAGLECMVVSRQWREYVCKCAKKAFESVALDARRGCQRYKALLDNIGLHVKKVLVKNCSDAAELVDMVTLLAQNDCQYLTSLNLQECYVPGDLSIHVTKLACLKELYLQKSSLIMEADASRFILSLITSCPSLKQLTIESPLKHDMPIVPESSIPPTSITSTLRSLYLRCSSMGIPSLENVLKHCPHLIRLRIPIQENECQQIKQFISQYCPKLKLAYLTLDEPYHLWETNGADSCLNRLFGLSIKASDAGLFLDQFHLHNLDLSVALWTDPYPSLGTLQQLLQQNASTLRTLILRMDGFLILKLLPFLHSMPHLHWLELDIRTTRPLGRAIVPGTPTTPAHHEEPETPMMTELIEQIKQFSLVHEKLERSIVRISDAILSQVTDPALRKELMVTMISEIPHLRSIKLCNGTFVSDMMVALFSYPNQVEHVHLTCGLWAASCELLRVMPKLLRSIYLHWQGYDTMNVDGWRQFANRPDGTSISAVIEYVPFDHVDCGVYLNYSKIPIKR